jgi:hypothetical protein
MRDDVRNREKDLRTDPETQFHPKKLIFIRLIQPPSAGAPPLLIGISDPIFCILMHSCLGTS